MAWIRNLLFELPADIKACLAFPTRVSFDDFTLPPQKRAKFSAHSSKASIEDLPVESGKIMNDHVYEIVNPSHGPPSIELVFFHGLQLKGSQESQEAHLDTWLSEDGKELWLNWILDEDKFPKARILTISYDAYVEKTETDGLMDMYVTTENLVQDLTQAGVGQNKCPVVLIGHCIGGLVMKELCVSATGKVARSSDLLTQPLQNFLGNLGGLFFYATPHFGTNLVVQTDFTKGCLFEDLDPLNKGAARQREEFCVLRQNKQWKTYGMGEKYEVTLGKFKGLIVPEASARCDVDDFYTVEANHFNICRPHARTSSRFINLINFIHGVVKEMEGQIHCEERVHKCIGLPSNPVGLKRRAQEVQKMLKGGAVLGIFGMGGIGKTTLAREVFNNVSKDFDYTCFIDNVKGFNINELRRSVLEQFYHKGIKLDGAKTQWSQMKGKKTLIAMDDTDSVDQFEVLPPWQDFGDGSCLIITSRNKGLFKVYEKSIVYDVQFLEPDEATQLFCKHAFSSDDIPKDKAEQLRKNVNAVVQKCDGLTLTLEVMGRYLRNEESDAVWEETIDNLQKAASIDGGQNEDDKVWKTLEVSYRNLSKKAQEMFCDAATFFLDEQLDTLFAAWSDRKAEATWRNLVDRAMVKEVSGQSSDVKRVSVSVVSEQPWGVKRVWVHEQLRDLARKLADDTLASSTTGEVNYLVEQLNAKKVNVNIKGLQLSYGGKSGPTLHVDSLVVLEELKYMKIVGIFHEGGGLGLTKKLRLLRWRFSSDCIRPTFMISLINMKDLAILDLSNCVIPNEFPTTLGNLRVLKLKNCGVPEGFHEALGNLKNLLFLSLIDLTGHGYSLTENLGNLSQLKKLVLRTTESLTLPKSFGQLTNLKDLHICAPKLETLPDSFSTLKSVRRLVLDCFNLERLPNGFKGLASVEKLQMYCSKFKIFPDDFSQLGTLKELSIRSDELQMLPNNFGFLKSVRKILLDCPNLERLPEGFGGLSSLEELDLCGANLKSLPEDFSQLTNLTDLTIASEELQMLPNNFGCLKALLKAEFKWCKKLTALPDSFGHLSALQYLVFKKCHKLHVLPDSFGRLSALQHLTISQCDNLHALADSFGDLSALSRLVLFSCEKLQSLPESFGQLANLQYLEISVEWGSDAIGMIQKLPDSFAKLIALGHLVIDSIALKSIPDCIKNLPSLHSLELGALPYVKDLPPWLGETGITPVAVSRKIFRKHDAQFSLTQEEDPKWAAVPHSIEARSERLFWIIYEGATKKVSALDYEGALAMLCVDNIVTLLQPWLRGFVLQENGIIKCKMGDLAGALEDLSAALGVFSEADDLQCYAYSSWKHRGFVNFMSEKYNEAQTDGEMALKLLPQYCGYPKDFEGEKLGHKLGDELVSYMHFTLNGRQQSEELIVSSQCQVLEMVRKSDFRGALAVWDAYGASGVPGYYLFFFLRQRGILKQLANDFHGALKDLTAALRIQKNDYECLRHQAYVKYLMGDLDGARDDGKQCLAMVDNGRGYSEFPEGFCPGEESVTYMGLTLPGRKEQDYYQEVVYSSHSKVMEKVRVLDFMGALEIWEALDTKRLPPSIPGGRYDQVYLLQERGILKRFVKDLHGALEDLTTALEIDHNDYDCLKHCAYVKYELMDVNGAAVDAERCLSMGRKKAGYSDLGKLPVSFLQFQL